MHVLIMMIGETVGTSEIRLTYRNADSTEIIIARPGERERDRESARRALEEHIDLLGEDLVLAGFSSPKEKAILRRREHAEFVGMHTGLPTQKARPIRKHRPCSRFPAWRVRALAKLMGTVRTRVRGSVPPGRRSGVFHRDQFLPRSG